MRKAFLYLSLVLIVFLFLIISEMANLKQYTPVYTFSFSTIGEFEPTAYFSRVYYLINILELIGFVLLLKGIVIIKNGRFANKPYFLSGLIILPLFYLILRIQ